MRVKAMVSFLQKYIPGNSTIVSEYIPGGGSRKAANHVYKSVRPHGLTMGNLSLGMVSSALLPEAHERVIREIPRDPKLASFAKKLWVPSRCRRDKSGS